MRVCACGCVGVRACACVCVRVLVRWSAYRRLGGLRCGRSGRMLRRVGRRLRPNRLESALLPPLAFASPCLARPGSVCLQCVPQHTRAYPWVPLLGRCRRRRRRRSSRRSRRCCRRHSLRTPSRLTRACLLQLLRARVCARACACRWRGRSRRWPAGKAARLPATQPRGGTRLCEVLGVLGVLGVLIDTVRVSPARGRDGASRG